MNGKSDALLQHFVSWMLTEPQANGQHYRWGTMKTYLSAIRDLHIEHRGFDPTKRERVRRVLAAARRYCAAAGRARRKWPLTANMIRAWRKTLDPRKWDDNVCYAAACLGFTGLHRVSEYAKTSGLYRGLRRGNVVFGPIVDADGVPLWVGVKLEHYKTSGDTWRFGPTYKHHRTYRDLCVVEALWHVLRNDCRPPTEPLFILSPSLSGRRRFLSRAFVTGYCKKMAALAGLPVGHYDTHSLRAGGACAMWAAGVPTRTIRARGRWKSDCFMIYITQSNSRTAKLAQRMIDAADDYLDYAKLHERLQVDMLLPSRFTAIAGAPTGRNAGRRPAT